MGENMAETIGELSAALGELESGQGLNAFDPDAEIAGPYLLTMPPVGADVSFTINDAEPGD